MASVFQNYYLSKQYRGWDKCSFLVGATRTGLSYYVCVRSLNYVVHVTIETLQTVFSLFKSQNIQNWNVGFEAIITCILNIQYEYIF